VAVEENSPAKTTCYPSCPIQLKLSGIEGRNRMISKDAYKSKMDAPLKEWSTKIAQLKSKSEVAETTIKAECLRQVDALRVKNK
jgi:hypothetical protein